MKAVLKYARITPRKLRLVADMIRGKKIDEALNILKFSPRRGAYFLIKLLNSAIANATSGTANVNSDLLYVKEIMVSPGSIMKRWRAAPRGRGLPIKKRTAHAVINLGQKAEKQKEPKNKTAKAPAAAKPAPSAEKSEVKA
jgi:large subunit ribosomal protein L22